MTNLVYGDKASENGNVAVSPPGQLPGIIASALRMFLAFSYEIGPGAAPYLPKMSDLLADPANLNLLGLREACAATAL